MVLHRNIRHIFGRTSAAQTKQMLQLLAVACLLAECAAQEYYYCNSATPSLITDKEFYLRTRIEQNDTGYPPGLACEFNAKTGIGYLIEIISFQVATATLTVSSLSEIAFHGSSLPVHRSSIVTTNSGHLQVSFNAAADSSRSAGVTVRVRAFESNGCPPGWSSLYGNCFGTSGRRLNYFDAQSACISMKANLLHIPSSYTGSLGSFMRRLPSHLRPFYTWIGLTDRTSYGQFVPYWLSGQRQYDTKEIGCASGGRYSTCFPIERCGAFSNRSVNYAVYMSRCTRRHNFFACSMPPGGLNVYYRVPDGKSDDQPAVKIWASGAGCLLVVGLIVAGIYAAVRSDHKGRTGEATCTGVVVTSGEVTEAAACASPHGNKQMHYSQLYAEAVAGGSCHGSAVSIRDE